MATYSYAVEATITIKYHQSVVAENEEEASEKLRQETHRNIRKRYKLAYDDMVFVELTQKKTV